MSTLPLFGILILDRDPFVLRDFPGLLQVWLQDAGGFAALGLAVYLLYALMIPSEQAQSAKSRAGVTGWMLLMAVLAIVSYSAYGFLLLSGKFPDVVNVPKTDDPLAFVKYTAPKFSANLQPLMLMFGGLFALLGIGQPFAASLAKVRLGRIYALTKLGFKEAVRSRMMLVFLVFLIPLLFPITWFLPSKPEDGLRITIAVTSRTTQVLLLVSAALLAAFAIPNDIKNQNLYTVVTKPVERFEIVLGRFLGYVGLMTVALIGMSLVGWLFIYNTKLDEKAAAETYMARMPVRGQLSYASKRGLIEGTNVGREFDYRKYIPGNPKTSQRAVWSFDRVPTSLVRGRDAVPCEFTFDIFRMTKGEENRGVDLEIRIVTANCPQVPPAGDDDSGSWYWADRVKRQDYEQDAKAEVAKLGRGDQNPAAVFATARPGTPAWEAVNRLAEKYGYYEVSGKEIFDYHPDSIFVPAGLFVNTMKADPKPDKDGYIPPAVQVFVKCTTPGQLLGMAEGDLYFLEGTPQPSHILFAQNYFKSAVGLWCRVVLVIGLAVCCSTYLAGVISFLAATFLFLAGYFTEHIADMASGKSFVGGPFRAINQLLEAKQSTMPLDKGNPLTKVTEGGDQAFAWLVRRFINMVPDVDGYSWTHFVSEGFNIPFECLVMDVVVLIGYLLPWFILGFFLMRSREVAA